MNLFTEEKKIHGHTKKQLPKGKLICKRDDKRYKWYYNKDGKQIYIPKKERKFAEKLAARKYLEHLHEDLLHEKMAIEFYIRHHKEGNADKMLTNVTYPCGQRVYISYQDIDKIHDICIKDGTGTPLSAVSYIYGLDGDIEYVYEYTYEDGIRKERRFTDISVPSRAVIFTN